MTHRICRRGLILAVAFVVMVIAGSSVLASPPFPVVFRVSEGVAPGGIVSLYGEDLTGDLRVRVAETGTVVKVVQQDVVGQFVRFVMPESAPGVYTLQVSNGSGQTWASKPVCVNRPAPRWISEEAAYPGMRLQLMGRNLDAAEMAERLAEGPVDEEERWAIYVAAGEAYDTQNELPETWAGYCAYRAVERPLDYNEPTSWDDDAAAWVAHTAAQPAAWIDRKWDKTILTAERKAIADLIREISGNPFRPLAADLTWFTPNVVGLAHSIYEARAFDRMPILAEALEEAGCTDADIVDHCRKPGGHVLGCWVLDLLLGKK